jgi:nucleoside-diphosphate-sugar epimerase
MKNIGIISCGWLGLHLAEYLSGFYNIYTTTRSEGKKEQLSSQGFEVSVVDFSTEVGVWAHLTKLDAIIITVPFAKRESVEVLLQRFENIRQFLKGYDKRLFLMSSIGIYPETETEITETTFTDEELQPNLIQVENFMKEYFSQLNILRLGGLMGKNRVFSNYNPQPTEQRVNHVHYEDICLVVEQMIQKNFSAKLYNVVTPEYPTKREIIQYQKGIITHEGITAEPFGKVILSDLLQKELNYEFKNPNPARFE